MKNTIVISVIILLLTSCGQESGDYYFEFDQVDHYSIEIDEGELFERMDDPDLTPSQELQQELIINDTPKSLSDTLFIAELENIDFRKTQITGDKIESINEIFKEKSHDESLAMACIAVYRDILIFRNKGKIVGISKICFTCLQHQTLGTKWNTSELGQSGDYAKLKAILYDK